MKLSSHNIPMVLGVAIPLTAIMFLVMQVKELQMEMAAQTFKYSHIIGLDGFTVNDKELLRKAKHIVIYGEDNNPIAIR